MDSIEKLLEEIKAISQKYEEIAKITGENYNVFEILGVRSDEDSHSRFLANILDPKGIHDCGDIFLKLFFEKFLSYKSDIDFSNCKVHREYNTDLGRIDIYINCNDFGLVIENKIYADDQPEQLRRYNDFLKSKFNEDNRSVFYLTLNGKKATKESHCGIKYMRLAYNKNCSGDDDDENNSDKDILEWLECCQEKVFNKPLIRETLEQYINLIRSLTGQPRRDKMSEVVKSITKDADNLRAAFEIAGSFEATKKLIMEKFVSLLNIETLKLGFDEAKINFPGKYDHYAQILLSKQEWIKLGMGITIDFCNKANDITYGIIIWNKCESLEDNIRNKFSQYNPHYKNNDWCPIYGDVTEYESYKEFCIAMIENSTTVIETFVDKINELEKVLKKLL